MSGSFSILNARTRQILADQAGSASTSSSRMKGLLGIEEFPEGRGLLIPRCSAIHTFFMRIRIDVIFVDRAFRVIRLAPEVPPWRVLWGGWKASSVIELPGGTIARTKTEPGDILECPPN
jgi:uncharacterized membrane protein (UPF0127 family)